MLLECCMEGENFQSRTFACFASHSTQSSSEVRSVNILARVGLEDVCGWEAVLVQLIEDFLLVSEQKSRICAVGVESDNGAAAFEDKNVNRSGASRN